MGFVKGNSHCSSLPRPTSPVEKYHSVACLERMTIQEGADKDFDIVMTWLLKEGGREGVGPTC